MGIAVGILMLKTGFPRIPGDIGNADTFPFPVLYKVVENVPPSRVMADNDRHGALLFLGDVFRKNPFAVWGKHMYSGMVRRFNMHSMHGYILKPRVRVSHHAHARAIQLVRGSLDAGFKASS